MHRTPLHTRLSWFATAAFSTACLLPAAQANMPEASAPVVREFSIPAPLARELRHKMVSPVVRELQIRLRHAKYLATYDAHEKFDGKTRAAVEKFQRDNALPVTGIVNQTTWDRLRQQSHEPTPAELGNTDVGPWFTGPKHPAFVMELQSRLKQAGTYSGAIDGELNSATRQAVASYRARMGLPAAEVMDERTWARLLPATRNPSYKQLFDKPFLSFRHGSTGKCQPDYNARK